jgi:glycerate dehydrogenase
VDGETIRRSQGLRFVGVLATGYNIVDVEAARERGIVVTNIPSYGTRAVAQTAFALLLEVCHHAGAHSESVHKGAWTACPDFSFRDYPLIELHGKTMGIVGMGRIGRATAGIAIAMGMEVVAFDPQPDPGLETGAVHYADLEELFARADVISLHCPLTDDTRGIIRAETIAKMKDGVIIINTARGQLVVEADLAQALADGKVGAAGLDVLAKEPPPANDPLLSAPNCIITPHIAWAPREARDRLMQIAVDNLTSFIVGRPANVV